MSFFDGFFGDFLIALGGEGSKSSPDESSSSIAPAFTFFVACLLGRIFSSEFAVLFEVEGLESFPVFFFPGAISRFLSICVRKI